MVAAMTMPTLIAKHQKKVVVTSLKKFYTNINQAIKLSENDNGPVEYWEYLNVPNGTAEQSEAFYKKYLAPYLKTVSDGSFDAIVKDNDGNVTGSSTGYYYVFFADGSAMAIAMSGGVDILFAPKASTFKNSNHDPIKDTFSFNLMKSSTVGAKTTVEPYTFQWDGTREHLFSHARYGCNRSHVIKGMYCAKLIQYDGWEISDDYPW